MNVIIPSEWKKQPASDDDADDETESAERFVEKPNCGS